MVVFVFYLMAQHMRVNFSGAYITVPHMLLYDSNICAVFQQVKLCLNEWQVAGLLIPEARIALFTAR